MADAQWQAAPLVVRRGVPWGIVVLLVAVAFAIGFRVALWYVCASVGGHC